MQKGRTVNDYTVTIGLGQCEDLRLRTSNLLCKLPKKEPDPGPGSFEKDVLPVTVSSRFHQLFMPLCFHDCTLVRPVLKTLQMILGLHTELIGYVKYRPSESMFDKGVVKWTLVAVGIALSLLWIIMGVNAIIRRFKHKESIVIVLHAKDEIPLRMQVAT